MVLIIALWLILLVVIKAATKSWKAALILTPFAILLAVSMHLVSMWAILAPVLFGIALSSVATIALVILSRYVVAGLRPIVARVFGIPESVKTTTAVVLGLFAVFLFARKLLLNRRHNEV
jgi:membrane glycosyltransferase